MVADELVEEDELLDDEEDVEEVIEDESVEESEYLGLSYILQFSLHSPLSLLPLLDEEEVEDEEELSLFESLLVLVLVLLQPLLDFFVSSTVDVTWTVSLNCEGRSSAPHRSNIAAFCSVSFATDSPFFSSLLPFLLVISTSVSVSSSSLFHHFTSTSVFT